MPSGGSPGCQPRIFHGGIDRADRGEIVDSGDDLGPGNAVDERVVGLPEHRDAPARQTRIRYTSHSGRARSSAARIRATCSASCSWSPGGAARSRGRGSRGRNPDRRSSTASRGPAAPSCQPPAERREQRQPVRDQRLQVGERRAWPVEVVDASRMATPPTCPVCRGVSRARNCASRLVSCRTYRPYRRDSRPGDPRRELGENVVVIAPLPREVR